jgi:hypothetical protein
MSGVVADIAAPIIIGQDVAIQTEQGINVTLTIVSKELSTLEWIWTEIKSILIHLQTIYNFLKAIKIFALSVLLLTCLTNTIKFITELFLHTVDTFQWGTTIFLPWFAKFFSCMVDTLFALPKCFLWYGLDIAGRILYLPFRFIFFMLDTFISGFESDENGNKIKIFEDFDHSLWCLLDDLDHYIHNKEGLGTGMHIIHFQDSIMTKCYKCKIDNVQPPPDGIELFKAYLALMDCAANKLDSWI